MLVTEVEKEAEASIVAGVRLSPSVVNALKEMARTKSFEEGLNITHNDLIRDAIFETYRRYLATAVDGVFAAFTSIFKDIPFDFFSTDRFSKAANKGKNILSDPEKNLVLRTAFETDEGRCLIAQNIHNVGYEFLNKHSLAYKVLQRDELHCGSLARYERRNKNSNAFCVAHRGDVNNILSIDKEEDSLLIPTRELAVLPQLRLSDIKRLQGKELFDEINRELKHNMLQIIFNEERILFALLEAASKKVDNYLADDVKMYLGEDDKIIFHESRAEFFRSILGPEVPLTAEASRKEPGRFIAVNHGLKDIAVIFSSDEKKKAGAIALRQNLTVLPADDPKVLKIGWVLYEEIGAFLEAESLRFLRF